MKTKTKTGDSRVEVIIRIKVNSEVAVWLDNLRASRQRCNVTSKAIEFYHWYLFYPKGFFIMLIKDNFEQIKHLLRQIGRTKDI